MSINTSTIKLDEIKYAYDTHSFITSGKTITSKDNDSIKIQDLLEQYEKIFNDDKVEKGKKSGKEYCELILTELKNTIGKTFSVATLEKENDVTTISNMDVTVENILKYTSDFYASAKTINGQTIDSNCLEGYKAYSFYLEKIILLLKKLNDAINQGQAAIKEISNLSMENVPANQTVEEYVNSKVHELSAELYLADKAIADVMSEFESCLKYNVDTKSWDKSSCDMANEQFTKPSSLDNLRGIMIAVSNANNKNDTHKITCFSELNLLNRLRYIRYYYEMVLGGTDSDYQIFPDDSETGYPCVPDIESTTDTKATESMGGFELFYVGYLVDRDGSIDAYSSCLEAKSKAITDNISLQSEHIEAYNQYLTFINHATQLLNESQSKGAADISHGAHLGLTYFCGGTMRDLLEVDGVNYIVLSYTNADGSQDPEKPNSDFNYGYNHRYLLVRADEKGLKALYNTSEIDDPNGGVDGKKLEMTTAGDLEVLFTEKTEDKTYDVTYDCEYTTKSYPGTKFYRRAYSTEYSNNCPIIVSSSEANREILIWDILPNRAEVATNDALTAEAKNLYKKEYEKLTAVEKKEVEATVINKFDAGIKNAEKYLPKQLIIQEIEPKSVAEYERYDQYGKDGWGYDGDNASAEEANRVINSWTTAFSNKSEYINTAIETINTDITALRTKMDTIDSLCSTLRNRSFETKKTLVSNLRS